MAEGNEPEKGRFQRYKDHLNDWRAKAGDASRRILNAFYRYHGSQEEENVEKPHGENRPQGTEEAPRKPLKKHKLPTKKEPEVRQEALGILMMGITGSGKSATGNSILGRREFVSRGGACSVTRDSYVAFTNFNEKDLKVVDVPGYNDTDAINEEEKVRVVATALTRSLSRFPDGFHAVLLVISYHQQMTTETQSSMIGLVKFFDEIGFNNNGILVVTNGDAFKRENPGVTLRSWLEDSSNAVHRWLIKACGNRCVLFDNVTDKHEEKVNQVQELMGEIGKLGNTRYLPEICQFPDSETGQILKAKNKAIELEKVSCQIGMLQDTLYKLGRIPDTNHDQRQIKLDQLISDAKMLESDQQPKREKIAKKLTEFINILETINSPDDLDLETTKKLNELIDKMQKKITKERESGDGENPWYVRVWKNVHGFLTSEKTWKVLDFIIDVTNIIAGIVSKIG